MTKYTAELVLNNEATRVYFECEEGKGVYYLWDMYGMSTHINSLDKIEPTEVINESTDIIQDIVEEIDELIEDKQSVNQESID